MKNEIDKIQEKNLIGNVNIYIYGSVNKSEVVVDELFKSRISTSFGNISTQQLYFI